MKLYAPAFEARLRRRVRPAWKSALQKHGPVGAGPRTQYRTIPGRIVYVFGSLSVAGTLQALPTVGWSRPAIGSFLGLLITALFILSSQMMRPRIERPTSLAALLWLPASDELIARVGWQRLWSFRVPAWINLAILLTGLALVTEGRVDWTMLPGLLLVSALGAAAGAGVVALPATPRVVARVVGLIVLFLAAPFFLNSSLAEWILGLLDRHAALLHWVHPGGWLVGLWLAVLHPRAWALEWLLALPLLALAESTRYWYRRHRDAVKSAELLEKIEWTGSVVSGQSNADSEFPAKRLSNTTSPPNTTEELRLMWRAVMPPLQASGRIQQWMLRRLTARERALCEALGIRLPPIARHSALAAKLCLAVWLVAWLGRAMHWASGEMTNVIIATIFVPLGWIVAHGMVRSAGGVSAWAPLGYREIRRLEWKLTGPIFVALAPWVILYACAIGWLQSIPFLQSALVGLKSSLLAAGLHPLLALTKFSTGSGDTSGRRWPAARIWLNVILTCLTLFGGIAGAYHTGWVGWGLMALAIATTWRFYAVHRRQWDRRKFDVGLPGSA